MTVDASLAAVVRKSARGFAERHRSVFDAVEAATLPGYPSALLEEVENLGWLASLTGAADPHCIDDEADLLASIVYELGRYAPALGARLLAHHFCRICLDVSVTRAHGPDATQNLGWFGLDATTGDERFAPSMGLLDGDTAAALGGSMRFVIGGEFANHWLGVTRVSDDRRGLVLVQHAAATSIAPVATLGLRGLGATEGTFKAIAPERFRLIAVGIDVAPIIDQAYRVIGRGYLGLTLSLLEQTQRIAIEHAQIRRQNGTLLREIPAVRQQLDSIERALSLVRLLLGAYQNQPKDAEALLREVRDAAARATDAGLQVLGGAGYIVGHGPERLWRDTRQVGQLFLLDPW